MLSDYTQTEFSHEGKTKPVYVRGHGPAVIVIHEIPGITPNVTRFADWVVDAGFRVYMPLLVGEAGSDEIGRAWCRERVCQYVEIPVVAGDLKKKNNKIKI